MKTVGLMAGVLVLASAGLASAQAIDLSKPYGNKVGCINRNGQEIVDEFMLLITKTELVTSASACTFTKTEVNKDGSLKLTSMCESEGEEAPDATIFTVKRGKKKSLVIFDQDGAVFGEVALCR